MPTTQYQGNEFNTFLRPNINPNQNRGFEIFDKQNKLLFSSPPEVPRKINWESSRIRDIAERLNLIDICTEFYPSSESQDLATDQGIKVDSQKHASWSAWFQAITKGRVLSPDTNILVMRTIRSVIIPSLNLDTGTKLPFKIVIPRLAILELENLTNRKTNEANKGMYFLAFNEIRRLKSYSSLTIPLSPEEICLFNKGSGRESPDALIREEIQNHSACTEDQLIYLTRDMVSALAANAEDLDSIYMALLK